MNSIENKLAAKTAIASPELRDRARRSIAEAQKRPEPKPTDYVWDAFISYRRDPDFDKWMAFMFSILKRELANHLGGNANVFMDVRDIKPGDVWPEDLKAALRTSRCLIAFVEPRYFASIYCTGEFETFLMRAAPIVPFVVGGGAKLPAKVSQFQSIDIEKYHLQALGFENNQRAEELELLIKKGAEAIAQKSEEAPKFQPDFPIAELTIEPARPTAARRAKRAVRKKQTPASERRVFLNVPFSENYKPLFSAIVFTLLSAGYEPSTIISGRPAESRLDIIRRRINECAFAIHDISEGRSNGMLELGMFLAASRSSKKRKDFIILSSEPISHYRLVSDLAGIDLFFHRSDPQTLVLILSNWLATREHPPGPQPSPAALWSDYRRFHSELPHIVTKLGITSLAFGLHRYDRPHWRVVEDIASPAMTAPASKPATAGMPRFQNSLAAAGRCFSPGSAFGF